MWSSLQATMLSAVARRYLVNPRTLGAASFCRRSLSLSPIHYQQDKLRVAIIGQSLFGLEVYKHLRTLGHEVAGVFTIPDVEGKADPLGDQSQKDGIPTFKFNRWRAKGKTISEVLEQYQSVKADLNVLPFCSQFIPMDVINSPKHGSIVYHPSLLPVHRGASAINWTLMEGDKKAGFSIFWADDGLDTGPVLLQRSCDVDINETVDSLYNRFLFPEGIRAMGEAVNLVAQGKAPATPQWEGGATYDLLWQSKAKAEINWNQPALELHNFVRGNDKLPGAWTTIDGQKVTMYGSRFIDDRNSVVGREVMIPELSRPAVVNNDGMYLYGNDDKKILITQLQFEDGKMIQASKWGSNEPVIKLELTQEELVMQEKLKKIWGAILNTSIIDDDTDFFKGGAGSMDVVRLVEEVREACEVDMTNDDVFMNSRFEDFVQTVVAISRGGGSVQFEYDACTLHANNREMKFPNQLFINGEFKDAADGKTYDTINPTDESVICKVASGSEVDVNEAVQAAHDAFYKGPWGKMNARERGEIIYRLADLMDKHKEELATLESIDSGAVYTLALKTHVGMSIDTFRYFAGWCDKIQGKVIPINNAKPNSNLCMAKREPLGVVGLVIPWNYPLMMLAWKMGACLAAGNTMVLKPAKVTPLTALKFAELTVHAGIPKGVINIIPGPGAVAGQVLSEHPQVRKMGFTGSTEVGKTIMKSAAMSNVKKVSLELGGKSPLIIFADADLEKAVRLSLQAVFFNKGENCIAAGRLFVERSIYEQFIFRVVEEVKKMKIGDPLDRSVAHGPQNHKAHLDKLLEYVEISVKEGARLVYGGKRVDRPGFFMEPTVLADVEDHTMAAQEESFGPVMILSPFETGDVDGVIKRANATEYGLASGLFTRDLSKALYVSDRIDAGTVFVNTYNKTDVAAPFGGFKQSGFGKDLGEEALNEYLKTKVVTVEY